MADQVLELTKQAVITPTLLDADNAELTWEDAKTMLQATPVWVLEEAPAIATGAVNPDGTYTLTPVAPGVIQVGVTVTTTDPITGAESELTENLSFQVMEIFRPSGIRLEVELLPL